MLELSEKTLEGSRKVGRISKFDNDSRNMNFDLQIYQGGIIQWDPKLAFACLSLQVCF